MISPLTVPIEAKKTTLETVEKIDPHSLTHGAEIKTETILPEIKYGPMLDEVIPQAGESVILGGGTMLFKMLGIGTDQSDLDFTVSGEVEEKFLEESKEPGHAQRIASLDINGVQADVISAKRIHSSAVEALQDIITQDNQTSQIGPDLKWFIDASLDSLLDPENGDTIETIIKGNSFFLQDALGLELTRQEDGSIRTTIHDPIGALEVHKGQDRSIVGQILLAEKRGDFQGIIFDTTNPSSFKTAMLGAILVLGQVETNSKMIINAVRLLNNLIKAECYKATGIIGEPGFDSNISYTVLSAIAKRVAQGETFTSIPPETGVFSVSDGDEQINLTENEWLKRSLQKTFAESAEYDPILAILYMTTYLPLFKVLADDIQDPFEALYQGFAPTNTSMMETINFLRRHGNTNLPRQEEFALTFMANLSVIQFEHFKTVDIPISTKEYAFRTHNQSAPNNMSQVIALIGSSMGWHPENDVEKIQEIIDTWKVSGESRNGFSYELELRKIQAQMRIYLPTIENIWQKT